MIVAATTTAGWAVAVGCVVAGLALYGPGVATMLKDDESRRLTDRRGDRKLSATGRATARGDEQGESSQEARPRSYNEGETP